MVTPPKDSSRVFNSSLGAVDASSNVPMVKPKAKFKAAPADLGKSSSSSSSTPAADVVKSASKEVAILPEALEGMHDKIWRCIDRPRLGTDDLKRC